jgi:hypothetical protein
MMKRLNILLTTIVLFPILLPAGCGTTASLVSRALPDNGWPRKRVMLTPAADLTGIHSDEVTDTVSEGLGKILGKTGFFNLYHQDKTREFRSFQPGEPIDPELVKEAKDMGMNAIIFETLNPIEINPVKTGIWPFRRKARRFTVSMNVDILDVNRGTIILSKEVADDITFSDDETRGEKERSTNAESKKRALNECLPDLLKKAAVAATHSLNRQVWTGTVVSADKKSIIINAGRDVGLRQGIVLEVFGEGDLITSFKGQTYQLPGPKVGEIRIVGIKSRHSSAEPIDGTAFKPGQTIRVKD